MQIYEGRDSQKKPMTCSITFLIKVARMPRLHAKPITHQKAPVNIGNPKKQWKKKKQTFVLLDGSSRANGVPFRAVDRRAAACNWVGVSDISLLAFFHFHHHSGNQVHLDSRSS